MTDHEEIEVADVETEEAEVIDGATDLESSEIDDGEIVVTIGDESAADAEAEQEEKAAPQWVKDLRKEHREAKRKIRELEQQVSAAKSPAIKPTIEVGKKPTLEECEYDTDKFETDLLAWQDRKRQADKQVAEQQAAEQEATQAWQAKLDGYATQKAALKLKDYDDSESAITGAMDVTQQGIIISGADNPALVIYALGRNDAKLKELAAIKDPVKFAFAIAKLETQVKMNKKEKPAPERTITGTAPKSGAVDSTLDRLRADAEKTGDYSKVHAYKRQKGKQ